VGVGLSAKLLGTASRPLRLCGPESKAPKKSPRLKTIPLGGLSANACALYPRGRDPLISPGALRPSCARALCGPRASSAAWHRLGCLLRGTTWPRLCTPSACTSQVLVCLLGAPPTGGTHSVSQTGGHRPTTTDPAHRATGAQNTGLMLMHGAPHKHTHAARACLTKEGGAGGMG
jgi:hypothetical protein